MYSFIKGTLVETKPQDIIVETYGIGYKIFVPSDVIGKMPQIGQQVHLHLSYVVRELSQSLYGFLSTQERALFEALMDVSGIGPKLALSIIGHMPPAVLAGCIKNHQIPSLTKIPGIGKKTAERLIIELRDKIDSLIPIPLRTILLT